MTVNTATEQAYKNGYERGYEDGKRDAVKVVWCKDCKYRDRCPYFDGKDSFCSYRVRGDVNA